MSPLGGLLLGVLAFLAGWSFGAEWARRPWAPKPVDPRLAGLERRLHHIWEHDPAVIAARDQLHAAYMHATDRMIGEMKEDQ